MSIVAPTLVSALIGYLFGAIPVGFLLVKARRGVDIRQVGSGRTGGTNSYRAGGLLVGIATSVLDVLKAACSVWSVKSLFGETVSPDWLPWLEVTAGVFAVVGHNWSIFIGWRGGAGTGPNIGWSGAVWLPIIPLSIAVVLAVLIGIGIASIATIAMAAAIPVSFLVLHLAGVEPYDGTMAYIVGGLAAGGIIMWSLRPNIRRLIAGQERIVGPRAKRAAKIAAKHDDEISDSER